MYASIDDGWTTTEFQLDEDGDEDGEKYKMHHRDPIKWMQESFASMSEDDFDTYMTPVKKYTVIDGVSVRVYGDPQNCDSWIKLQEAAGENHRIMPFQVMECCALNLGSN
jgi:hypothetical protein